MKEYSIRLPGDIVRAIIDGNKRNLIHTVTPSPPSIESVRRAAGIEYAWIQSLEDPEEWHASDLKAVFGDLVSGEPVIKCPFGIAGTRLKVTEAYASTADPAIKGGVLYQADSLYEQAELQIWKPAASMPDSASRLLLEVSRIRVMPLSSINREDGLGEALIIEEARIPSSRTLFEDKPIDDPWMWAVDFNRIQPCQRL